ncbi:MAG: VWA domain-containing protein [Phycisphaeraceae bacterium]
MSIELLEYMPLLALLAVPLLALGLWCSLVDRPRGRRLASWALRVAGVVLLVLALAQPYLALPSRAMHVVFLIDVSESVDLDAATDALAEVDRAIAGLGLGDSWSLLAFGRSLRAYQDTDALREALAAAPEAANDDRLRSATRLGHALTAARLALPGGKAHRIALYTDAHPTDDGVAAALAALAEQGVDVRLRRLPGLGKAEAAVLDIEPSTRQAFESETVRLTVRMAANTAMDAELRILSRGAVVARQGVRLQPGSRNRAAVDVTLHAPGPTVWTAELVPERDHFPINNQASCTIHVAGQPRILALHERPRELRQFARAMQRQQFHVDVRPPPGLPRTLDELLAFDAVILAAMPATDMSPAQMQMLKRYVEDFGGGVMMLGSEVSFGLGGYYRTPVEDVLPLISRFEQERQRATMAMVLVIDKSGSMQGTPVALARQAAAATVDMLGPQDQIGVVAFDGQAYIISEVRPGTEAESVKAAIARIDAGGGTHMYAGMTAAQSMLQDVAAQIKHMIVLSDGQTQPADHLALVDDLLSANVTVSTVALGSTVDRQLLATIAQRGRGRYYETTDPTDVPRIFTRETTHASRSAIHEDVFGTVQVADHPALVSYERAALPVTLGYVMTQARPTAQILLATDTGDPLLATMRYGLGTGMAYSSDLAARWGGAWLGWPDFGAYWGQILRSLVRSGDPARIVVRSDADENQWRIEIQRRDEAGRPLVGIDWSAQVIDAFGRSENVAIEQRGLGRYHATIPVANHERLALRLHDRDHDRLRALHYHRPYPAEYRLDQRVPEALAALPPFHPSDVRADLEPASTRRALMPALVIIAMALMITGIALRRI